MQEILPELPTPDAILIPEAKLIKVLCLMVLICSSSIFGRITSIFVRAAAEPCYLGFDFDGAPAPRARRVGTCRNIYVGWIRAQGGARLGRSSKIAGFGCYANWSGDKRWQPVAFDFRFSELYFGARISPECRFAAIIPWASSMTATILLITAAASSFLKGPLILIRFIGEGL